MFLTGQLRHPQMSQGGKTPQSRALPEPVCLCPRHPGTRVQHRAHPLQEIESKFRFTKSKGAGPYNPKSRPKAPRRRSSVPAVRGGRGGPSARPRGDNGAVWERPPPRGHRWPRWQKDTEGRGEPRRAAGSAAGTGTAGGAGPNEGSTAQGWPRPRPRPRPWPPPPGTLRGTHRFFRQKRTISDG